MTLLKGDFHSRIKKRFYKSKSSLKNWKSHYNVKLQIPDTDHTYKRGYLRPYFPPDKHVRDRGVLIHRSASSYKADERETSVLTYTHSHKGIEAFGKVFNS